MQSIAMFKLTSNVGSYKCKSIFCPRTQTSFLTFPFSLNSEPAKAFKK